MALIDENALLDKQLCAFYDDVNSQKKLAVDNMPLYSSLTKDHLTYVDEELIAHGGMKSVFKVRDLTTKRYIAMARLHHDASKELYEPFLREAYLTAQLDHPNIITVHAIGLDAIESPFFTMELKKGKSLATVINDDQGFDDRPFLLDIFIKVCEGISYAHSKGILHLDLKPQNIQVGCYGEVTICDWGLSKVIGNNTDLEVSSKPLQFDPEMLDDITLAGEIKGTLGFMAPEQAKANQVKTKQTDIYALGVLLYLILTKEMPIHGTNEELISKTISGDINSPISQFPEKEIPQSLSSIVMQALALNPDSRYQSIDLLIDDLKKFQNGFSTQAEHAGVFKELQLFYSRNKTLLNSFLVSLAFIVVLTFFYIRELNSSKLTAIDALKVAEREEQRSVKLYKEAEENLERFKEERNKVMHLGKEFSEELIRDSTKYRFIRFYRDPKGSTDELIKRLRLANALTPGKQETLSLIGQNLFIKQNFGEAYNYLYKCEKEKSLAEVCLNFRNKVRGVSGELLLEDFILLLKKVGEKSRYNQLSERMALYDLSIRQDQRKYHKVMKQLLLNKNKRSKPKDCLFIYDEGMRSLKIIGDNIKSLCTSYKSPYRSILGSLNLEILDISQTGIVSLNEIKGLEGLRELIICGARTTNLSFLQKYQGKLRKLIVLNKALEPDQIARVPRKIRVINP
ncbi:MAG: serine/threonine protein kinase [Lentisphaeraceae bacterium]|nr:serine/threonine protein kinase [Lentisphaeraceae bacterium]